MSSEYDFEEEYAYYSYVFSAIRDPLGTPQQGKANMGIVVVLPGSRLHRIRSGSRRVQASGTSTNGVSLSLTLSLTAVTELTLALDCNKKISTASM